MYLGWEESCCFTSSIPELSGIGRCGGEIQQKPWVCDDSGKWVTKRSQRRAEKEKRPRKTPRGCDARLGGQAGHLQPTFWGQAPAIAGALGELWEENGAAHRQQLEGGETVGILGLL